MKKILLVSGCSNTDKRFLSDVHPRFRYFLAKMARDVSKKIRYGLC